MSETQDPRTMTADTIGKDILSAIVMELKRVSISMIQRHLRIGYNRASRLVEAMELKGVVSPIGAERISKDGYLQRKINMEFR